jgi:hypothetical protein
MPGRPFRQYGSVPICWPASTNVTDLGSQLARIGPSTELAPRASRQSPRQLRSGLLSRSSACPISLSPVKVSISPVLV